MQQSAVPGTRSDLRESRPPRPILRKAYITLLMSALLIAPLTARAATYIQLESVPGDPLGDGMSETFTLDDGEIVVSVSLYDRSINIFTPDYLKWEWSFVFEAPRELRVGPGEYPQAIEYSKNALDSPGIRVGRAYRECTSITGRFVVLQAEYNPDGKIERLALDFTQHCGHLPPLNGFIRINSDVPISDLDGDGVPDIGDNCPGEQNPSQADLDRDGLGDTCDQVEEANFILLQGEPGEYLGMGRTYVYTPETSTVATAYGRSELVTIQAFRVERWRLHFTTPEFQALAPGSYENAVTALLNSPYQPGIFVDRSGRSCGFQTGRFEVHEARFGEDGQVEALALDFEQHCGSGPALYGIIRLGITDLPLNFDADEDGIIDIADNCRSLFNTDQLDGDEDGTGDDCDPYPNEPSNLNTCLASNESLGREIDQLMVANESLRELLVDRDGDGVPDLIDTCPSTSYREGVDGAGCSLAQFCAGIKVSQACRFADWRQDEPLAANDCAWSKDGPCRPKR